MGFTYNSNIFFYFSRKIHSINMKIANEKKLYTLVKKISNKSENANKLTFLSLLN